MRLLVIDGNSIANRAFYGIKLLTTKDGRYTNAIFGFLNIMNSLLRECEPDEVAVAFDLKHPTFRHEMYDGYKGTRHAMPDELAQQMPILKELLTDLGYRQVSAKGWEADDILGTLAAACEARRDDCFLATGDRDSLRLVSETTVLLATSAMGRSKTETMDLDAIHEKYGIEPKQLIEVKSLMGDTSDNIPGVKGIGEKTAMTLVKNFGTLDNVYDHLDSPIIKPRQRENLLACQEDAYLSHTLGTIRTDAPIDTAEGAYKVTEGNKPAAVRLMQELEIQTSSPGSGWTASFRNRTPIPCRRWTQPLRPCPQSPPATIWWPHALLFWAKRARSCSQRPGTPCRTPPCIPSPRRSWSPCWTTPR